jgi:hypothetical protein
MRKLMRCMLTTAACIGLLLGTAKYAAASCGDGITSVGEACDAGTATCAAGSKEVGSECHNASDCTGGAPGVDYCVCTTALGCNRDDLPDHCRSNCMNPMCGDGVSDAGEQCDNGAANASGAPCYGSAPNTVCSDALGVVIATYADVGSPADHNPAAMIPCTTDGQCSIYGLFCRGNPQCRLNQCGDGVVCSDAACTTGLSLLAPGIPSPEQCDDGNTSNMDACLNYNYTATLGTALIPEACASNICGDGISNMGVEQCDEGASFCLDGPKTGKPCCTNSDCMVGNVMGTLNCSGVVGILPSAPDNNNAPNSACRCNCELPFCGDGISDNLQNEECDDGTTANSPGQFCNKEKRCVGGENGCLDANANGQCDSDATENNSRLASPICTDNPALCVKGTCGKTACVQNTCGDQIVGGNEMCDDGNTVDANTTSDSCGVNVTTWLAFAQATGCSTTLPDNFPGGCPPQHCMLPFCGDGVTEDGEMCDSGASTCSAALAGAAGVALFNPGALCCQKSDCKTSKLADGTTPDVCGPSPLTGLPGNRNDIPNACRCNCMPPLCGDGVSDTGEQCEPPASGTFCIKNAMGMCVLNVCGDGDVCNKTATDACLTVNASGDCVPGLHPCGTGPTALPNTCPSALLCSGCAGTGLGCDGAEHNEQCDDGNTVDPSSTNTDTCGPCCGASTCGDGVTNPALGEQCDACDNGCSNGREDLNKPELPPECCLDGNVVDADKVGLFPGLISVERGFAALLSCRMPNLVGLAACNRTLQRAMTRVQSKITSAEVYLELDDITKSRRIMRTAERSLYTQTRRISRLAAPGKACSGVGAQLANETANAAFLTGGIVAHMTEDSSPFGP